MWPKTKYTKKEEKSVLNNVSGGKIEGLSRVNIGYKNWVNKRKHI